jgi:hypothetical protein
VVARVRVKLARDARRSRNLPGDQTVLAARHVSIEERWTLARHGEEWFLVSLADDPLSAAVMSAPLITSPLDDDERLREAGLRELSAADASRADAPRPAELADRDVPAPQELRDLAVADGRFDPALLEATIRHVVDAWEQSSDGVGQPLAQVAGKNAIRALQYPGGPGGRRFIRDAALRRWEVTAINQVAERPTVRVAVKLRAAVYRGDGRHFSGSDRRRRKLDLVWTLRFDADAANEPAWRLLDSADA